MNFDINEKGENYVHDVFEQSPEGKQCLRRKAKQLLLGKLRKHVPEFLVHET